MKTNYIKKTWMHFSLAVSVLGALATVAHAESFSVAVPFAFEAAGKSFPAGSYSVDSVTSGVLVIRGASSGESAAIMVSPSSYSTSSKTSLVFEQNAAMPVLSTVNMNSGLTLSIMPSKRLTATLALPSKGSMVLSHP